MAPLYPLPRPVLAVSWPSVLVVLGIALLGYMATCNPPVHSEAADEPLPAPPIPSVNERVVGYHPYWSQDAWRTYDFSLLDELIVFDLSVGVDGTIEDDRGWPYRWVELMDHAEEQGTRIVPAVTILEAELFATLFSDAPRTHRLLQTLTDLAASGSVGGLHLEFEVYDTIPAVARAQFTGFVQELRAALDRNGRQQTLSMFMVAFDLADAYDEPALAAQMDYLVVQGYDLHWITAPKAGPVAPLTGWNGYNWEAIVARFDAMGIPRDKMLMSVPYYGYAWPTVSDSLAAATRGKGLITPYTAMPAIGPSAREEAQRYGLRRDPVSGSPYYAYQDTAGWWQGWFEDTASLADKYAFVKARGLGGVAVFPLSYGDITLEATLRSAFGASVQASR